MGILWNLWNFGEGMKIHTESLSVSKLHVGDTCEGTLPTFFNFPNGKVFGMINNGYNYYNSNGCIL